MYDQKTSGCGTGIVGSWAIPNASTSLLNFIIATVFATIFSVMRVDGPNFGLVSCRKVWSHKHYPYFLKKQKQDIFTLVNIMPVVVFMVFTFDVSHDPKTANTTCHTGVLTEIPILP